MKRAVGRRNAMLAGIGAEDRGWAHITDTEQADARLRAWFSGTDIDIPAFHLLGEMLVAAVVHGINEGVPPGDVVSSAIRDAFTIGFWTREAMVDG